MSAVFDAYEAEFLSMYEDSGADLSGMQDLIKSMELELRSQDSTVRQSLFPRLEACKSKLEAKKKAALTSSSGTSKAAVGQRYDVVRDKLAQQNEKILQATAAVHETEAVGNEILDELASNRSKIEGVREKTTEFSGQMDDAKATLKRMQNYHDRSCVVA